MRALFKCQSVKQYDGWSQVELFAATDGVTGHNEFSKGAPSGMLTMAVTAPLLSYFFCPGGDYNLDITPARVEP